MFSANSSQVSDDKLFVEDVFSTYLYTGNGSSQTITNGIDLAGKGGMVWVKSRSAATNNFLFDTARGVNVEINSNTSEANATLDNSVTAFNSNGFAISSAAGIGVNAATYASWTFREAPKFFDVVTYTGNGVAGRQIAHSLGVAPGCIFVKCTSNTFGWPVYHRSLTQFGNAGTGNLVLNSTDGNQGGGTFFWNNTDATSTVFTLGDSSNVNQNGATYVAYLFAHDAASDGVIQCGSFTTDGSGLASVTLGYEPQWILVKRADAAGNWTLLDTMRGLNYSSNARLFADLTDAESAASGIYVPTATGFNVVSNLGASRTFIYMAIRRGPMRTPTLGTSVFAPVAQAGGGTVTTNFPVDTSISKTREASSDPVWIDRIRGFGSSTYRFLASSSTSAEITGSGAGFALDNNTGYRDNGFWSGSTIYWNFRRAPSFFDEVCYTGTGALLNANHNLGVSPELMLIKSRSAVEGWTVYSAPTGNDKIMNLNATTAAYSAATWNNTTPSATTFTLNGGGYFGNISGATYVAYLFASCPGVSKVGSYTGNGSSQTINCGFAAGARFVMIKRTDSAGDWYVWDTARGIVAGNDPHLSLNTTATEVTSNDTIDTASSGFVVNQVAATNVNVSSATYIYLAIA